MDKRLSTKNRKKAAAIFLSGLFAFSTCLRPAHAQTAAWDIENTVNVSECRQGETVKMAVNLKSLSSAGQQTDTTGTAGGQQAPSESKSGEQKLLSESTSEQQTDPAGTAGGQQTTTAGTSNDTSNEQQGAAALAYTSLDGTLEYDTSLFTVGKADIIPAQKASVKDWSFDPSTGEFHIQYASGITVQDDGLLLEIQLHVAADASTGKTTVCVTHMKWQNTADPQTVEIEHRIPARLTIAEAKQDNTLSGDVNEDGKVNLTDAKMVMQYYNGTRTLQAQQLKNADVNGDGKVNLTDVKLIMRYFNGEISGFS